MMLVFLDFEASSLGKRSYPIEVAWVFEDGTCETHLIRPAPGWDDWDPAAEAIHRIARATLLGDGEPHEAVARRMLERLAGHDLRASAPSWDGKWLSTLLRAAGLPRHALRLGSSDAARHSAAGEILADRIAAEALDPTVDALLARLEAPTGPPAHRALADAQADRDRWLAVRAEARRIAAAVDQSDRAPDGQTPRA